MTKPTGVLYGPLIPYKKRESFTPAKAKLCQGCGEAIGVPCINERGDASDQDAHRFCSEQTGGQFLTKISTDV